MSMSMNVPIPPPPHHGSHPLKFPIVTFIILFLIVFFLKSTTFSDPTTKFNHITLPHPQHSIIPRIQTTNNINCTNNFKLPQSLSKILIHYATSRTTPQQTISEISVTQRVLLKKSPCNFLIFGLGHDSLMWSGLNTGGHTLFLEENADWISEMEKLYPNQLNSHQVNYSTTQVSQSDKLLRNATRVDSPCEEVVDPRESKCELALKNLPKEVYEVEWDLIMVDGPTGYRDDLPGRMTAIYTAGLIARNRKPNVVTDVFLHDVDRVVEDKFSRAFLCDGYLKEEVTRLRHFIVPSQRGSFGKVPFCPLVR